MEDQLAEIQDLGQQTLIDAGFDQPMRSQLLPGMPSYCKHNINYWQFGDYIGIGAGAHGKISLPDKNKNYSPSKNASA